VSQGLTPLATIARNGKDVAVSFFHFSRSHHGFRGTFDEFFDRFMWGRVEWGSWFKHVKGWWHHRKSEMKEVNPCLVPEHPPRVCRSLQIGSPSAERAWP
jgi:hypothetical protein